MGWGHNPRHMDRQQAIAIFLVGLMVVSMLAYAALLI